MFAATICVVLAIASYVSAQPPLKPEEQAALILNAGHRAYNEKQWNVAADRYREYMPISWVCKPLAMAWDSRCWNSRRGTTRRSPKR
jgi:hypothetical protein